MLATALFLLTTTSPACPPSFEPIAISAKRIDGELLNGKPDPSAQGHFRVGVFGYQGYGIVERSSDPRYRDLMLDPQLGRRHRCGNAIDGPSGWNARDRDFSKWSVRISAKLARTRSSPGSVAAEERGARPVRRGYRAGATWPVYVGSGRFFLGLMHPTNRSSETLIVAFRDASEPTEAVIMAKLPMVFQTLAVTPGLHESANYLNLEGLRDGELRQIVLRLDRETSLATLAKLEGETASRK